MKRSSAELKFYARNILKGNYSVFIGTSAIYLLITVATMFLPDMLFPANSGIISWIIRKLFVFITSILTQLFFAGLNNQSMRACRGQQISVNDLFYAFRHDPDRFIKVALVQVLISNIITLPTYFMTEIEAYLDSGEGFVIFFTLYIAYIVVAVFLLILTVGLTLRFYVLIDYPQMGTIKALKTSWKLMKGNKGRAFYISFSFFGFILLGIVTFGIALLWVTPYMNVTTTYLYFDILGVLDVPKASPAHIAPVEPIVHSTTDDDAR